MSGANTQYWHRKQLQTINVTESRQGAESEAAAAADWLRAASGPHCFHGSHWRPTGEEERWGGRDRKEIKREGLTVYISLCRNLNICPVVFICSLRLSCSLNRTLLMCVNTSAEVRATQTKTKTKGEGETKSEPRPAPDITWHTRS